MMKHFILSVLGLSLIGLMLFDTYAQPGKGQVYWSQFRGPNCSGIASPASRPPALFGENDHLLWKITLPAGASSPSIWDDKSFCGREKRTADPLP